MFTMFKHTLWISLFLSSLSFAHSQNCSDPAIVQFVQKAKGVVHDIKYMTLATADVSAAPWNTPLYTAYEANFRSFYWISEKTSHHSQNVRANNRVFVVIYDSTAPGREGFGVYMQGQAYELNEVPDIAKGVKAIFERAEAAFPSPTEYQGTRPQRIYKFLPLKFWVNTVVEIDGKEIDKRVEITDCI